MVHRAVPKCMPGLGGKHMRQGHLLLRRCTGVRGKGGQARWEGPARKGHPGDLRERAAREQHKLTTSSRPLPLLSFPPHGHPGDRVEGRRREKSASRIHGRGRRVQTPFLLSPTSPPPILCSYRIVRVEIQLVCLRIVLSVITLSALLLSSLLSSPLSLHSQQPFPNTPPPPSHTSSLPPCFAWPPPGLLSHRYASRPILQEHRSSSSH